MIDLIHRINLENELDELSLADQMGTLKAAIAELDEQLDEVKNLIYINGGDEGELFNVTVSKSIRKTVDWKGIANKVGYSHQLLRARTTEKPSVSIRCNARKQNNLGVAA